MPVTRSVFFFSAGFVAGAAAGANLPKLKETLGPRLAEARDLIGDAYTHAARAAAEKVETLQDTLAEMKQARATGRTTS